MANPEHVEIVKAGKEAIDEWRKENPYVVLDLGGAILSETNLSEADLSKADLSYATLSDAALSGASFCHADLSNANFRGSNLQSAEFFRANLSEANLSETDLSNANFKNAQLIDTNLRDANLRRGHLPFARFNGANLSGAILKEANLSEADLINANVRDADLSGATLTRANLINTSGFYGRFQATLKEARDAETAIYSRRWDIVSWSLIRTLGSLPLFGVSYFGIIIIWLWSWYTHFHNMHVRDAQASLAVKALIEQNPDSSSSLVELLANLPESTIAVLSGNSNPVRDMLQNASEAVLTELSKMSESAFARLPEIQLTSQTLYTLSALIFLAAATTLYKLFCPPEIQESSETRWVHELNQPCVTYRALSYRFMIIRWITAISFVVGGAWALWLLVLRLRETVMYLWAETLMGG